MTARPNNIWVFFGGISSEREVSLRTAKGVEQALADKKFNVRSFDVSPGKAFLEIFSQNPSWPDIVFLALHGTFAEDGRIQGFLDYLKIPYVGSGVFSSALCFHKGLTKKMLESSGVLCPKSIELRNGENAEEAILRVSPLKDFFANKWFVKAAREGSTFGVYRYRGEGAEKFYSSLSEAFKYDNCVLVEEWVEGPELTVTLMHGKAYPVIEIRPLSNFYDYESKYTAGKTEYLCPAPISKEQSIEAQQIAEKCFSVLECDDYARVDMMLGATGLRVLEMNTLPGLTETSLAPKSMAAAGLSYADFLEKLIVGSYERQVVKT